MDDAQMSTKEVGIVRTWLLADRQLAQLYASLDPREPTRVVVEADGKREVVELTRVLVNGSPVVVARRLKLHGG